MKPFSSAFRRVLRQKLVVALAIPAVSGLVMGTGLFSTSSSTVHADSSCEQYVPRPGATFSSIVHDLYPHAGKAGLARINKVLSVNLVTPHQQFCLADPPSMPKRAAVAQPTPVPARPAQTPTPATPVAKPTQPPTGGTGNSSSVEAMIEQVFGPYAQGAINVARCESGLNPNAYNPSSNAAGLFQILYPSTWDTTPEAGSSPYNAMANILAAHYIFVRDGYSWREWTCQP